MNWTNELILLAPRILPNRKPLEYQGFIGLFTSIKNRYSKGFIYLVYKYIDTIQEKDLEGMLNNTKYYYNKQSLYTNGSYFIIFSFYYLEEPQVIEDYKNHGNIGFNIEDYASIFIFWGDKSKDIKHIYKEDVFKCECELNEERLS